jgi:hypothetical protein
MITNNFFFLHIDYEGQFEQDNFDEKIDIWKLAEIVYEICNQKTLELNFSQQNVLNYPQLQPFFDQLFQENPPNVQQLITNFMQQNNDLNQFIPHPNYPFQGGFGNFQFHPQSSTPPGMNTSIFNPKDKNQFIIERFQEIQITKFDLISFTKLKPFPRANLNS